MHTGHEFFSSPNLKDTRQYNLYPGLSHMQLSKLRRTNSVMNQEILEDYEKYFKEANKALFIFLQEGNLPHGLTTWITIDWVKANLAFQLYILKHFTTYPLAIRDENNKMVKGTIYLALDEGTLKFTALIPNGSMVTANLSLKEKSLPLTAPLTMEQLEPYKDEILQTAHKEIEEAAPKSKGVSIGTGKLYSLVMEGFKGNQHPGTAYLFKDQLFQYCYNQKLISYEQLQALEQRGKAHLLLTAVPLIADGHLACEELLNTKVSHLSLEYLLQQWIHPLIKAKGFTACLEQYCMEQAEPRFLFLRSFVAAGLVTTEDFIEKADEWIHAYYEIISKTEHFHDMYRTAETPAKLSLLRIFSGYFRELKQYIEQRLQQHENKDKSDHDWINNFSMYCKQSLSIDYLSKTETAQAIIDAVLLGKPGAVLSEKHLAVLARWGDLTAIGDRMQKELNIRFSDYSSGTLTPGF